MVFKSEFKRIEHFYRLALLTHCDNLHHEREHEFMYQLGLKLGLNSFAIKRVLGEMDKSLNRMIDPDLLLGIFKEHHNYTFFLTVKKSVNKLTISSFN